MGKRYFTKKGFKGLSLKGKIIDIAIFLFVGVIGWIVFEASGDNIMSVLKSIAAATLVAWIAQFFLPRDTYYYQEYFCADCGQYLGKSPKTCSRCGSNRYSLKDSGVGQTVRNR